MARLQVLHLLDKVVPLMGRIARLDLPLICPLVDGTDQGPAALDEEGQVFVRGRHDVPHHHRPPSRPVNDGLIRRRRLAGQEEVDDQPLGPIGRIDHYALVDPGGRLLPALDHCAQRLRLVVGEIALHDLERVIAQGLFRREDPVRALTSAKATCGGFWPGRSRTQRKPMFFPRSVAARASSPQNMGSRSSQAPPRM